MPGLVRAYGLRFQIPPREMDLGLLYQALRDGQVDLVVGSATDGLIAALGLVVLEDDRRYFPPYDAVPVVRTASLERHPRLAEALSSLAGRIDAATMRRLNLAVDGEHRDPADVAREFLHQTKRITTETQRHRDDWKGTETTEARKHGGNRESRERS